MEQAHHMCLLSSVPCPALCRTPPVVCQIVQYEIRCRCNTCMPCSKSSTDLPDLAHLFLTEPCLQVALYRRIQQKERCGCEADLAPPATPSTLDLLR